MHRRAYSRNRTWLNSQLSKTIEPSTQTAVNAPEKHLIHGVVLSQKQNKPLLTSETKTLVVNGWVHLGYTRETQDDNMVNRWWIKDKRSSILSTDSSTKTQFGVNRAAASWITAQDTDPFTSHLATETGPGLRSLEQGLAGGHHHRCTRHAAHHDPWGHGRGPGHQGHCTSRLQLASGTRWCWGTSGREQTEHETQQLEDRTVSQVRVKNIHQLIRSKFNKTNRSARDTFLARSSLSEFSFFFRSLSEPYTRGLGENLA
jgi:hypothetical protein